MLLLLYLHGKSAVYETICNYCGSTDNFMLRKSLLTKKRKIRGGGGGGDDRQVINLEWPNA